MELIIGIVLITVFFILVYRVLLLTANSYDAINVAPTKKIQKSKKEKNVMYSKPWYNRDEDEDKVIFIRRYKESGAMYYDTMPMPEEKNPSLYGYSYGTSSYYVVTEANAPAGTKREWLDDKRTWGYSEPAPTPKVTIMCSEGMMEVANEICAAAAKTID